MTQWNTHIWWLNNSSQNNMFGNIRKSKYACREKMKPTLKCWCYSIGGGFCFLSIFSYFLSFHKHFFIMHSFYNQKKVNNFIWKYLFRIFRIFWKGEFWQLLCFIKKLFHWHSNPEKNERKKTEGSEIWPSAQNSLMYTLAITHLWEMDVCSRTMSGKLARYFGGVGWDEEST